MSRSIYGPTMRGRVLASPGILPSTVPIPLDAAAFSGAVVRGSDGYLYHSDGTSWRLNRSEMLAVAENVTVGTGGTFATIADALVYASRRRVEYNNSAIAHGLRITILAGHTIATNVLIRNMELAFVTIQSVESTVNVDGAALLPGDGEGEASGTWYNVFAAIDSRPPAIATQFVLTNPTVGNNYVGFLAVNSDLRFRARSAEGSFWPTGFAGFIRNVHLRGASRMNAVLADFPNSTGFGIWVNDTSRASLDRTNVRNATLNSVRVSSGGVANLHQQATTATMLDTATNTRGDYRRLASETSTSDIAVVSGGMVTIGSTILGGRNINANTLTSSGIIWDPR
jgi:hypothetical protein